jgi:hypothetical protein
LAKSQKEENEEKEVDDFFGFEQLNSRQKVPKTKKISKSMK